MLTAAAAGIRTVGAISDANNHRTQIGKVESSALVEQFGVETDGDDGCEHDRIRKEYG